ncbi:MAG: hypothetical protein AAFY11_13525 [Cyanobacteria bacterium J06641_5]
MIRETLLLIALSATGMVAGVEAAQPVPERFQGEWNTQLQDCSSSLNDSRLEIGVDRIAFHESSGPILAVIPRGEQEVALVMELSGEGETWLSFKHYRLSDDRTQLIDITDGGEFARQRCSQ